MPNENMGPLDYPRNIGADGSLSIYKGIKRYMSFAALESIGSNPVQVQFLFSEPKRENSPWAFIGSGAFRFSN
jgi:hypothetical protein